MGLDMYLYRKNKRTGDSDEAQYWRKANWIRKWLVNHTDLDEDSNCEYTKLSKEILEQLIKDCEEVVKNHELASELMPTASKFFFGNTEYSDYYFENLEYTAERLREIINETNWETEDIYYYEWW